MEGNQAKVDVLQAKLLTVKDPVQGSGINSKELHILRQRVKSAGTVLSSLTSKARIMAAPHMAHASCGIKQLDGVGLVDKNGVPLYGWSSTVDLSSFQQLDDESWLKLSSQNECLDEHDGAYTSGLLNSIQMVMDVMEGLVKRVLMAESETATEKEKVTLGQEEIRRKVLQVENMSVKLEEMERFAVGTNCVLNEMKQKVEDLVEETSRQRLRASENEQELSRVKRDFVLLKSHVSGLISVRETLLSSEKQFQTIERIFERAPSGFEQRIGLFGSGAPQQSLSLSSNWSLGGANKYGFQSASTWPAGGTLSTSIGHAAPANPLMTTPNSWRSGDWICTCGFHNYSSRAQCKKCNSVPPAAPPIFSPRATGLGTKRLASDELAHGWDSKRLNAGQTYAMPHTYSGADTMGFSNFNQSSDKYSSYLSGSSSLTPNLQVNLQAPTMPAPALFGKGAKQWRDGDWMCVKCNNHNYASRSQCNRCKTEREVLSRPVTVA